jgi:hypothetical protein
MEIFFINHFSSIFLFSGTIPKPRICFKNVIQNTVFDCRNIFKIFKNIFTYGPRFIDLCFETQLVSQSKTFVHKVPRLV